MRIKGKNGEFSRENRTYKLSGDPIAAPTLHIIPILDSTGTNRSSDYGE